MIIQKNNTYTSLANTQPKNVEKFFPTKYYVFTSYCKGKDDICFNRTSKFVP